MLTLIRYLLPLFIILIYYYIYWTFPYRFSNSNGKLIPFIKTNVAVSILIIIMILIELLFIIYLSKYVSISSNIPKYWWIIIPVASILFIHFVFSTTDTIKEDKIDTYVGKPDSIKSQTNRKIVLLLALFLIFISISIEVYVTLKGKLNQNVFDNIFYGKNNLKFYIIPWTRIINIIILIFMLIKNKGYMCNIELPFNWND